MTLLKAYFDESGTHGGSVTAIGGLVGVEAAWTAVESEINETIKLFKDKGVEYFHAAECAAQEGQYAGIDKERVSYIFMRIAKAIGSNPVVPIMSAVVQQDWDAVAKDVGFLKRFPKPFDLCFDDIVRQLWEWGAIYAPGEKIVPMFGYQKEYQSRMNDAVASYGSEKWYKEVLGPISFGHMDQVVPLQAADFIAHQSNWDVERRRFHIHGGLAGPTLALKTAVPGSIVGHWFDGPALALTVKRFSEIGSIYRMRAPIRD